MPTSAQLIQTLQNVIATDLQSQQSIIRFFTGANLHGGWEGWLQCVYAKGVAQIGDTYDFAREVKYPGTELRADVWFKPRGAEIWVELKTQRYGGYANAVADFSTDIGKILDLPRDFRDHNVNLATATLILSAADRITLNAIRAGIRGGTLHYFTLAADNATWTDVTATILTAPVGFYLLAVWLAPN